MKRCSFCNKSHDEASILINENLKVKETEVNLASGIARISLEIPMFVCSDCILIMVEASVNFFKKYPHTLLQFLKKLKDAQEGGTPFCGECGNAVKMDGGTFRCPECHNTRIVFPEKKG